MKFNDHSKLEGQHALLGASKYFWLNYDKEKMQTYYQNLKAIEMGTTLHEFAANCIKLGQKLPKSKKTLNNYVNDAIGYMMQPEQILYYSENCFGTADSISFRNNFLRIHDLKTGKKPAKMEQLLIYAALFCLEYKINPGNIKIELRIYQSDEIIVCEPGPADIAPIMDKIITMDKVINAIKYEED